MMGQVDALQQIRTKIATEEAARGASKAEIEKTDKAVKEFLEKPEIKTALAKKSVAEKTLQQTSKKLAQLEAKNPELAAKFAASDLGSVPPKSVDTLPKDSSIKSQDTSGAEALVDNAASPMGERKQRQ